MTEEGIQSVKVLRLLRKADNLKGIKVTLKGYSANGEKHH